MCPRTQERRYAGTQAGTSYQSEKSRGRLDQLTLSVQLSTLPKRLRILPDEPALSIFPVPVHQGVLPPTLQPHQILLAHCRPTFKHNHRLLSALGGHILNPGQTFNLSRVHQLFSPRCVASPLDAMRCDTM